MPHRAALRDQADPASARGSLPGRRFALGLALLLAGYLVLETVYVLRLPLVMDELQGATEVERLRDRLPYRDFPPYKTVLGYYLQLPVLVAAPGWWSGLLLVKLEMALTVAVTLAWAAVRLARRLRPGAVLLALAVLLSTSNFLERSAELRVDMPTALAGLVSLILLFEGGRRGAGWAGAWAALAILISQKGAFYPLAGGAALGLDALLRRDREGLTAAVRFAVAGLAVGAAYLAFWAAVAGGDTLSATVDTARGAIGSVVEPIRRQFWLQTLTRNPVFWLLSAASLALTAHRGRRGSECGERGPARRLAAFAGVLLVVGLWYEQPWPYFFVLLLPTLWVVQAAAFDRIAGDDRWRRQSGRTRRLLVALVLIAGVAHPLATRVPRVLARDNGFQRYNVELTAAILAPGGTYLAGVDLLANRRQAHQRLAWIDQRQQAALHALPEGELRALIDQLEAAPPKLVVWNYRIANLPPLLRTYLAARYRHLTGNLLIYSPVAPAGEAVVRLAFTGEYVVEVAAPTECAVGGRPVSAGERVRLRAGRHATRCAVPMRLSLVPPSLERRLVGEYHDPRALFPAVYHY
ncbi:MAG TPA: hypothetical protein VM617_07800 [Thermoanaerobaculia bacterium]|nr:hypothetical protein [Thermoanaerobaculia bacterium]